MTSDWRSSLLDQQIESGIQSLGDRPIEWGVQSLLDQRIEWMVLSFVFAALVGSLHCAGMCGPLSLLAGGRWGSLLYQSGRLLSYITIGAVAGSIGQPVFQLFSARFHIAITLTIFLVGLSLWFTLTFAAADTPAQSLVVNLFRRVRQVFPPLARSFALGFLTGFLPCGWLWTFVGLAAATGSRVSGITILFCLWLGSSPALLLFPQLRTWIGRHSMLWSKRVIMSVLLLAFFFGLMAPYIH
ncbi:MAG: hypothetical protein C5B49_05635 [Bdellovibrio sp.]|nr:MAG: hypothetical protein C5B49_05635 [Bdellovibrio sp.]